LIRVAAVQADSAIQVLAVVQAAAAVQAVAAAVQVVAQILTTIVGRTFLQRTTATRAGLLLTLKFQELRHRKEQGDQGMG
jgi:hypothetical protein